MHSFFIRFIDLTLSLLGLIATLPIMVIILVIAWFDTRSPLFLQKRVGKDQKVFTLVKFRTMAPSTASVATHLIDANAVTRLGHFLRRTKLDELPQLINVVAGHMSLVGPRPCLPNQRELIGEREKRGVFMVRPGITGLAQVNQVDMSTPAKLAKYDQTMIVNFSLTLYFRLIAATLRGSGSGDRVKQNLPK